MFSTIGLTLPLAGLPLPAHIKHMPYNASTWPCS
jgi:hypothetical protein